MVGNGKGYAGREKETKHIRVVFLFFKQKTAYEISHSLVGSEMSIRDSSKVLVENGYAISVCDPCLFYRFVVAEAVSYTLSTLPTTRDV